jgi:hypothetical protein
LLEPENREGCAGVRETMNVKLYSRRPTENVTSIVRFLKNHQVSYEQIQPEEMKSHTSHLYRIDELPTVEVDGHFFINPNEDALRKIFRVA